MNEKIVHEDFLGNIDVVSVHDASLYYEDFLGNFDKVSLFENASLKSVHSATKSSTQSNASSSTTLEVKLNKILRFIPTCNYFFTN